MNQLNMMEELPLNDAIQINGGEPDKTTSFAYDITYAIVYGVKWVVDLF